MQPAMSSEEPEAKKQRVSRTRWTSDAPATNVELNSIRDAASLTVDFAPDAALHRQDGMPPDADLVLVGVHGPEVDDDDDEEVEGPEPTGLTGAAAKLDEALGGALSAIMAENAKMFRGGGVLGATTPTLRTVPPAGGGGGGKSVRYALLGLGKQPRAAEGDDGGDYETLPPGSGFKLGAALAAKCTSELGVWRCSALLPRPIVLDPGVVRDLATSFYSDLYSDNRYRTGDKVKVNAEHLTDVTVIPLEQEMPSDSFCAEMNAAIAEGKSVARGIFVAKDVVNAPHNMANSVGLANLARSLAAGSPGGVLSCTVLGKEECEARGMGAYLAVARGSETPPQFIHLVYTPRNGRIKRKVGLVGKGVMFDTGGYNIKVGMMALMKFDCGGAAALLGAARSIAEIEPSGVEAHFIVPACENMINEKSYVPSDIVTASNGKTIEVLNTDAEGRLTLADALVYADKEVGCESIIELSTLTGAAMVYLGKLRCGVWTSNDDLAQELDDVSKSTDEKAWRMPMATELSEKLDSIIADMKNIGDRFGGAIQAALFLQHFVSKKKPFAHIDIAGPVWNEKTGATGFGVKMVTEWILRQGQE